MNVIERSKEGYSAHVIDNFFSATKIACTISRDGKLVPIRAVCLQMADKGFEHAEDISRNVWNHGYISFEVSGMDSATWAALETVLDHSYSECVDIIMVGVDEASPEQQEKLGEFITIDLIHRWIFTVRDHRKLIPGLRKQMLIYAGLSQANKMTFLVQDDHRISAD
jgi:hypothetical protein